MPKDKKYKKAISSKIMNEIIANVSKKELKLEKEHKSLKNIKPIIYNTKVRYGGHKVAGEWFKGHKGGFTREDIIDLVRTEKEKFKGLNMQMMISLDLKRGWRSNKQFNISDNTIVNGEYDDDWNSVPQFVVYMWEGFKDSGGEDNNHNDCLYNCMLKSINHSNIKDSYNQAWKLKKRLGLQRDDKISINLIPKLENGLHVNINVTGDHYYVSSNKYSRTMNLKLSKEHYSLIAKSDKTFLKGVSYKSQSLSIYKCVKDDITNEYVYTIYDGNNERIVCAHDFYEIKNSFGNEALFIADDPKLSLEESYRIQMDNFKQIYDATNGVIDYSKTSGCHIKTIKKLFHNMTNSVEEPEDISELEELYLMKAFKGGLIYSKAAELNNAICIDKNSAYPSSLNTTSFTIPLKAGKFSELLELPDIIQYGIYRCKITKIDDINANIMFMFNKENYYTHIDINNARLLKLNIVLIVDGQANALIYASRISSTQVFRPIIKYLYDLKEKKVPCAKHLLNSLWGMLCQKNSLKSLANKDEYIDIPIDNYLLQILQICTPQSKRTLLCS